MANSEGVNIVITGDASQAENEIHKLGQALDSVNDAKATITLDGSQAIQEAEKVSSTVESMNDSHIDITADSSQAVSETEKAADAADNLDDAHIDITADGAQAVDEARKVADAENSIKDTHATITIDGAQATREVQTVQQAIDAIDRNIEIKFSDQDIRRQLQKVIDYRNKITSTAQSAGNEAGEGFSSAFFKVMSVNLAGEKIEALFGGILSTIARVGQSIAGTLSRVVKSAMSIGGGFEATMTSVKIISGATEKDFKKLIEKAREMGATLPITAKDAATAMQLLAQRGTQARDILASVSEVANLTISQGVDMGSAADLLGSTMTNFGIKIEDASKVTAVFNNACNQSALSMSKLIEAMKYVGPAAGAVGMELTEAVSGMEAIANAGLTGEMTGTGMALVLSKLAAATKIMGVNTKELDGSLRPLKDIFTELKAAGFSLTDAIEAFGQRGSKAALALAKNSDDLEKNRLRLQQWGSTQQAVDAKAKTFTNTMAALQSAIEEFHIEVFEQIKDQSKQAVGGMAELTRAFSDWVGETKIAGKTLNAFLEGLGFNIPSGDDFKKLLQNFDVQPFIDKVKDFGATLKTIAESIASMFNKIKTPLSWLIEHFDTFTAISFWGWILGKGLQVPAAVLGIASSFTVLASAAKTLFGLSWTLLANPVGAALAAAGVLSAAAFYAYNKAEEAANEEKRIKDEAERIKHEVDEANKDLLFHVDVDFTTGFEDLPASYAKAGAEVRQEVKETVAFLQEQFRDKAAKAVEFVTDKFPDMSEAFKGTANDISDDILSKISKALQGSEKDFEALPEIWRKVTERINAVDNGLDAFGVDLLAISEKYDNLRNLIAKPLDKNETQTFFDELSTSIKSITDSIANEIERANKFLSGSNGQLAVNVSLSQAQAKLQQFVKSASEKYSLPEDIVKASLIDGLNKLALTGNNTAQSLVNGFKGAGDTLDDFLSNAKDAITYLEASPDKFLPALNSMMKGIQRIDPLTGKLTEQFKKAHDALKQWGNMTFDQLTNRIQKLRRAVEGGFIDQSALEAEFNRVLPQLKVQVVSELQPQREQYRNDFDFQSVVASELISRINDLFGDVGINLASKLFNGQTGSSMGRMILNEVERGFSGASGTFKIDGINQLQKGLESIASLPQSISNAVSPYVAKLETLNTNTTNNQTVLATSKDYSQNFESVIAAVREVKSEVTSVVNAINSHQDNSYSSASLAGFSPEFTQAIKDFITSSASISKDFQALGGNIDALRKSADDNISALSQLQASFSSGNNSQNFGEAITPLTNSVQNLAATLSVMQGVQQAHSSNITEVINAVRSIENAIKSINAGNNFDIDINQQGFVIEKKSDADLLARSTVSALRAGLGNGGI